MKKYDELNVHEQKEVIELFAHWLKCYTHEVIVNVMAKRDEILANDFAMNLMRELKKREEIEAADFQYAISKLLRDLDGFKQFDPHLHVTTHSDAYRHILYDMYIR